MISARLSDGAGFDEIDKMMAEMMAFRLPGEQPDDPDSMNHTEEARRIWRLSRAERPRCGARTQAGLPCKRQALANGRCPNHGGLSCGPKTKAGKARITKAQRMRWQAYRALKNAMAQNIG